MEDDIAPIRAYPKPLQLKASVSLRFLRIVHSCHSVITSEESAVYTGQPKQIAEIRRLFAD